MRQYRVWTHPETGLTEAVKQGWSRPAFLFGGLWALAKRMTLLGIFMLLGSLAMGYVIVATQVEDEDFLLAGATFLLGLFFGANGNSWREWYLKKRRFSPVHTVHTKVRINVLPPFRTLLAHPIVGLKALWHDPVWSKVIAGIILGVLGIGGAYLLRSHSAADRLDNANIASHHHSVPTCKSATIYADVQTYGAETFAWFEWGRHPI